MDTDTSKKVQLAAAKHYKKLYTMLLESTPSSVLVINRDLRIVSANRNFLEKSQRSLSNTVGQRHEKVFPEIIMDHINIAKLIRRALTKNEPIRGERMTYRAPGVSLRIYYYSIVPITWQGVTEGVMLLMDDVTEQVRLSEEVRRMERRLASIVESVIDIVTSTDTDGNILTWNRAAETLTGYTVEEVTGAAFLELLDRDYRKNVWQIFSSMKASKKSHMIECNIETKRGVFIPIAWHISPMEDEMNQTVGIVAVGRDLTERRKLETQLLQSQKLAALGVMAGGIAHEIRNPLTICSSAAQFLRDDIVDTDFRKECAEKIYKGINRISTIIENLLKFARPSVKSAMSCINIISLIQETITLVAHQAGIQKIKIKTSFLTEATEVNGIPSLLQQVFMNLLLNAMNAMPDGGILDISLKIIEDGVAVRISDTGHGIPKKYIDKIFDPFFTTSKIGKGTGLGLSLCYSIINQHKGTIDVESIEGKGSIFTIKLRRT